jgi:stage V sporulation protein B
MALTSTLFSANASEALRVVYKPVYQAGSHALAIVAFGMLFFGFLYVLTTIISASGRPVVSLALAAVTLVVNAALNALLILKYGLVGAAIGTTVSMFLGAAAASMYLKLKFGSLLSGLSTARIVACAGAIYALSRFIAPSSKLIIVAQLAGLAACYFALLLITGEIGRKDLKLLARVAGR